MQGAAWCVDPKAPPRYAMPLWHVHPPLYSPCCKENAGFALPRGADCRSHSPHLNARPELRFPDRNIPHLPKRPTPRRHGSALAMVYQALCTKTVSRHNAAKVPRLVHVGSHLPADEVAFTEVRTHGILHSSCLCPKKDEVAHLLLVQDVMTVLSAFVTLVLCP